MSAFTFGHRGDRSSLLSKRPVGRRTTRAASAITRAAIESLEERRLLSSTLLGGGTSTNDLVTAVTRQADGKVIVAGSQLESSTPILTRFNTDGSLDTHFGANGGVIAGFLANAKIDSIAVDNSNSGAILATGAMGTDAFVARFTSTGAEDLTFAASGPHPGYVTIHTLGSINEATTIAVGGRIAIGGFRGTNDNFGGVLPGTKQFFVAELSNDGNTNYFTTSTTIPDGESTVNSVIFAADGTTVFAGGQSAPDNVPSFTVAKYFESGALDTDFSVDGIATTTYGNGDAIPFVSSSILSLALTNLGNSVLGVGTGDGVDMVQYDVGSGAATSNVTGSIPDGFNVSGVGIDDTSTVYVTGGIANTTELGSYRYISGSNTPDSGYGVTISLLTAGLGSFAFVSPDGTVTQATSLQVTHGSSTDYDLAAGNTVFASSVGFTLPSGPPLVTATVNAGVLTITGTAADNSIQVRRTLTGAYRIAADAQDPIFITDPVTTIVILGGDGNDTIVIASSVAVPTFVFGEGDNDTLTTNGLRTDNLDGGTGNDTLTAGGGDDILTGGEGDDLLNGGAGNDELYGELGNDTLNGGAGDDILNGGADNDVLNGGAGNDFLDGGANDDLLNGDGGNDELHGRDGTDNLNGGAGDDFLFGENDNDNLTGSGGNDIFIGGDGNDSLSGGAGRDVLIGGAGADTITGDAGDDLLIAGSTDYDDSSAPNALTNLGIIRSTWNNSHAVNALLTGHVYDDGVTDFLSGNGGKDWFIINANDSTDFNSRQDSKTLL